MHNKPIADWTLQKEKDKHKITLIKNTHVLWTNMRKTVRSHVKTCQSCQINKKQSTKYGKLPTKLVVTAPWEALCVDLIGPYIMRGKDGTEIDFMCLTMIGPDTSWFEVVGCRVASC